MKTFLRVVLILVSTAAYLGLAVLGWGGLSPFLSHPALVALVFVLFIFAVVSVFAGGNLSAGEREDRGNRWVLFAFGAIGLLDGFLPAWADRREFWILDGEATRWVGIALYAVGGTLRLWPVFVMGPRFSGLVAIQPGHALVTRGIYSVIRHPSYLGLLVGMLGWGLIFRSGVGVLLTALIVLPLLARIAAEERLLHSQFGTEYDAYPRPDPLAPPHRPVLDRPVERVRLSSRTLPAVML
jgi:protein-S-isoprenylcysteine O-methyltransferase Ste14